MQRNKKEQVWMKTAPQVMKGSVADSTVIREGKLLNGNPSVDELKNWVESL